MQRIKQVLNNLMSNAMKYTPDGGSVTVSAFVHEPAASIASEVGKLKLTLPSPLPGKRLSGQQALACVTVSDTGIGIADDLLPKLFSKFQQLNNATLFQTSKAPVLALLSPKASSKDTAATIGVVSQVGSGSVFYFVIPFSDTPITNLKA
jgi:signal transduction histidine kinase